MPAYPGRTAAFTWGGTAVEGVREKGITVNGEPIDISSDDDAGWRKLLDTYVGEMSVDLAISGVVKDDRFMTDLMAGTFQRTATIVFANGKTLSGTFHLANVGRTVPYKDAMAFDASLQSSGPVTFS